MCGIFGYLGPQDAAGVVLDGLERLAYRGYDSAGVAVIDDAGHLEMRKAAGKLDNLLRLVEREPLSGQRGIGHTRWATHGPPSDVNAHPHLDGGGEVVVVHNGIVENYMELRDRLAANGHVFSSATDTEVIPHLIQELLAEGVALEEAVRLAARQLRGAHAIACMHARTPETLVAVRVGHAGGISIGGGNGEMFVSSDLPALAPLTSSVTFLRPGEVAVVNPDECSLMTLDGRAAAAAWRTLNLNSVAAEKGGYKHFMLKEIMEQPESAMSVLRGRLSFSPEQVTLDELPFSGAEAAGLSRAVFLGMGTSVYAGHVGARYLETLARIPATAANAAEFRYWDPVVDERTLAVAVTQSGETADTLEALHEARLRGARTIAITNVEGSQASRDAECALLMHAGAEIGVASTKTLVNSMAAMYLLACVLGRQRGVLDEEQSARRAQEVTQLPALLGDALDLAEQSAPRVLAHYLDARRFLFIGRGLLEPIAREGALKLKEISYIHAEGMPAAEIKHGSIALIDAGTATAALVPTNDLYEKTLANVAQVRARGGRVIAIAASGNQDVRQHADDVLWMPDAPYLLQPIVAAVPVQLFAYRMADLLGNDIDQPRNLAKSVTVE